MQRIRSLVFMTFYVFSVAFIGILAAPIAFIASGAAPPIAKIWARIVLPVLKFTAGVSYRIEGIENIPDGGAVIAANHQSQWETIALYAHLPRPVFVLKQELLRIPVYGWWAKRIGNIAVDREGGAKALRAMRNEAAARIAKGEQIIVFPEGTRSPVGSRRPYLPGVAGVYAAANAPCVPAAHNSGEHWRHPGPDKIPGEITLRFLPPIAPGLDRKTFLRELQTQIENARPDLNRSAGEIGRFDD